MSLLTITRATRFISLLIVLVPVSARTEEWKVDLSRRVKETRSRDLRDSGREPASTSVSDSAVDESDSKGGVGEFFRSLMSTAEPMQEMVILNTDTGFVPNKLFVREGAIYKIHVVNVNEKEKNVSFVLDAFSEHHATYYGKIKTFMIRPQKEGVYRFISPETSATGKLVVGAPVTGIGPGLTPPANPTDVRQPANSD